MIGKQDKYKKNDWFGLRKWLTEKRWQFLSKKTFKKKYCSVYPAAIEKLSQVVDSVNLFDNYLQVIYVLKD